MNRVDTRISETSAPRRAAKSRPTVTGHPRTAALAILPALLLPTLALTLAAAGPGVLPGDVAVARWLQTAPPDQATFLAWFAFWAGGAPVVIALGALLALLFRRRGESRLAAIALGILLLRALNPLLKFLVASPRPAAPDVLVTELAPNLGFPSGHVMGATLLYGGIIWLAEEVVANLRVRRAVQIAAALVILITGFGRVYTGAHWPSDVLGGVLWGVTGLVALAVITGGTSRGRGVGQSGS